MGPIWALAPPVDFPATAVAVAAGALGVPGEVW